MTKLLKYLLPLCLLVSSGFSQLENQAIEQAASHFSEQSISLSTANETTVRAYNHGESGKSGPICIEQEEEDETETSQEDTIITSTSADCYAHNFLLGVQKRLTLSKYLTYLPSYKSLYILFEVFRI